jgi:murein DD-endopeptidase MepM/ murein hydrolase activator NlpD
VFWRATIATTALMGVLIAAPANADTKSDLEAARQELAAKQAELDALTLQWQQTETKFAQAQDAVRQAEAEIGSLQAELARVRRKFDTQVRAVYMSGGNATIGALLGSDSFADFADRLRFATSIVQGDEDLATQVSVQAERLRRTRERLTHEAQVQADAAAALNGQRVAMDAKVSDLQSTVSDLYQKYQDQLAAQQAIGLPPSGGGGSFTPSSSGAISICPVQGPVSFVDSFGWPRPGGRIHEGIDMLSPYGTPVVAVHSGNAVQTPNSLGGNAVIVYHDGGDFTYYAHMSSYGATGHVGAGQVIGYVGSTGDTNVNHLHFEYHPGGGSAIDPYQALLAVC